MSDEVTLKVNGAKYYGWISVEIKRSMKALAGAFELSLTSSWRQQKRPWILIPGDSCEVLIGTETLISGYVDTIEYESAENSRTLKISGRDKTSDLIDCSVDLGQAQWPKISLDNLIKKLISPYKISYTNNSEINPIINDFKINPGSTVHDVLNELSKKYGFVAASTTEGNLALLQIGDSICNDYIEEGSNTLTFKMDFDHKDRYSKYKVKGQTQSNDNFFGNKATSKSGSSIDSDVERYRPLVIVESSSSSEVDFAKRAALENTLRSSKSTKGSVKIRGWRDRSGALWKENKLVNVKSNYLGLDTQLLISDVAYSLNESGRVVTLSLVRKEVFLAELQSKKSKGLKDKKADPWDSLKKGFFSEDSEDSGDNE